MPWLHSQVKEVSTGTEMTKMRNRNIMAFMSQSNLAGMCFPVIGE